MMNRRMVTGTLPRSSFIIHNSSFPLPMLHCIIVTPERTVRDCEAQFVALPLYDGEIGIALGHTPLVGRLGAGEMRITGESGVGRFYVEGGFVEVAGDVVSVLTPRGPGPRGRCDGRPRATPRSAPARPPTPNRSRCVSVSPTNTGPRIRVARRGE